MEWHEVKPLNTSIGNLDSRKRQVIVEAYSPVYDLGIIRDGTDQKPAAFLELHPNPSEIRTTDVVSVHGHPRGIALQQTFGGPTQDGLLDSVRVNDEKGRPVFYQNIPLLSIDVTTEAGMSGGPVILDGKVAGVLCASMAATTSRTFSYAIPSTYIEPHGPSYVQVSTAPENVRVWQKLTLLDEQRLFPRSGGRAELAEPFYHLFVSGPAEAGWKNVGTFQQKADAELAGLEVQQGRV